MLKAEIKIFLLLILLMQTDLSVLVGYVVPVLCGLALNTGIEVKNGTISWRWFLVKMFFIFGLCPMVYYVYEAFKIKFDISITLFVVTFLSDFIVTHGGKLLGKWVLKVMNGIVNKNNIKDE